MGGREHSAGTLLGGHESVLGEHGSAEIVLGRHECSGGRSMSTVGMSTVGMRSMSGRQCPLDGLRSVLTASGRKGGYGLQHWRHGSRSWPGSCEDTMNNEPNVPADVGHGGDHMPAQF